jgi:hypothetical protein
MTYVGDLCKTCNGPIGENLAHLIEGFWYHEGCEPKQEPKYECICKRDDGTHSVTCQHYNWGIKPEKK